VRVLFSRPLRAKTWTREDTEKKFPSRQTSTGEVFCFRTCLPLWFTGELLSSRFGPRVELLRRATRIAIRLETGAKKTSAKSCSVISLLRGDGRKHYQRNSSKRREIEQLAELKMSEIRFRARRKKQLSKLLLITLPLSARQNPI
jgi:hypothetical protein